LGGAIAASVVAHVIAIGVAVLGFGRQVPAAKDPAAIMVIVAAAAAPAAAPSQSKPPVPPAEPPPTPEVMLPPPEEQTAVPDFKPVPPPPPPPPKPAAKPAPPKPPVGAAAPAAPFAAHQNVGPIDNAPSPSAAPAIVPGWNVRLGAWLRAHQRYPSSAQSRGEEGDVMIRFSVDAEGHVTEVVVEKSSGHAALDEAATAMLRGATVPPPGTAATRTVRIHYSLSD
jgi:protein TonB